MISVIIPVYNGEKYISECIESILSQTYSDFEILLIDDGSIDNSGKLLERYTIGDSRIKVIHKPNGGVSSTRNIGIELAKGEYIAFVDCDDVVHNRYCEKLLTYMQKDKVVFPFCTLILDNNGRFEFPKQKDCVFIERNEMIENHILNKLAFNRDKYNKCEYAYGFWGGLYKKSVIDQYNLRFCEDLFFGEDSLFLIEYLIHCQAMVYAGGSFYGYRQDTASVMHRYKAAYHRNIEKYRIKVASVMDNLSQVCDKKKVQTAYTINICLLYIQALSNYKGRIDELKCLQKMIRQDRDLFLRFFPYAANLKEKIISLLCILGREDLLVVLFGKGNI